MEFGRKQSAGIEGCWLLAALLGAGTLGGAGCEQTPGLAPVIEAVHPPLLGVGQRHYALIEGRFQPRIDWTAGAEPRASAEFAVRLDGWPADRVRLLGPGRLGVRLPALQRPGCAELTVIGPGGGSGRLAGAVCAREVEALEWLFTCPLEESIGLCSLETGAESRDAIRVLDADVLPLTLPSAGATPFDPYHRAFAVDPSGRLLALLRERAAPELGPGWSLRRLVLRRLDEAAGPEDSGWEVVLAEVAQPPWDDDWDEPDWRIAIGEPRFSRDGRYLVWVEQRSRLMLQQVPQSAAAVPPARSLIDWSDRPGVFMGYPDVSSIAASALVTRLEYVENPEDPMADPLPCHSLYRVALDGQTPAERLAADAGDGLQDGPGAFHPDGRSVIFISDRLGMDMLTPFLDSMPVTNLYRLELASGRVELATAPVAGSFAGRPEISADGRWAACSGFLSEDSFKMLDVLLADLEAGRVERQGLDRTPFCYPDRSAACTPGESQPCCRYNFPETICCSEQSPLDCPTWELLPSFAPDSSNMAASYMPWHWQCGQAADGGRYWMLSAFDRGLGLAELQADERWQLGAADPGAFNADVGLWAPLLRQRLVPEQ